MIAFEVLEDGADFFPCHDDRQPLRSSRANGAVQADEFSPEDLLVQKDEGGEGLVLGGGGDATLDGQMREDLDDLDRAHVIRMADCVVVNGSPNPADVRVLGNLAIFADKSIFEFFVYVVTQVFMPVGGILVAIFAGWVVKRQFSSDELYNGGQPLAYEAWLFIVRFVAPVLLSLVLYDVATQ